MHFFQYIGYHTKIACGNRGLTEIFRSAWQAGRPRPDPTTMRLRFFRCFFLWILIAISGGVSEAARPQIFSDEARNTFVSAVHKQVGVTTLYDPAYVKLTYPGGDVSLERGVCTDVILLGNHWENDYNYEYMNNCSNIDSCSPDAHHEVGPAAELFKCMGDPCRLAILHHLREGELPVGELAVRLQHSDSAVSHQLRILRALRLVKSRRVGRSILYHLDDAHISQLIDLAFLHINHTQVPGPLLSSHTIRHNRREKVAP